MSTTLSTRTIMAVVAIDYGVGLNALIAGGQSRTVAEPRHVAMWLVYRNVETNMPEIGDAFGNRDSTTVRDAVKVVERRIEADAAFAARLDRLIARIAAVEEAKLGELRAIEAALGGSAAPGRASRTLLGSNTPVVADLAASVDRYLAARRRQRADKYTRGELASRNLADEAFAALTQAHAAYLAHRDAA